MHTATLQRGVEKFEYVYSKYSQYDYLWRDYLDDDYLGSDYDSLFYEKVKCEENC